MQQEWDAQESDNSDSDMDDSEEQDGKKRDWTWQTALLSPTQPVRSTAVVMGHNHVEVKFCQSL